MEKDSLLRVNAETRLSGGFGDWASSGDPLQGGVRGKQDTRGSRKLAERTVEQVCRGRQDAEREGAK